MRNKMINYIQAGYPGLYIVSPEEQRIEVELKAVIDHLNIGRKDQPYELCYWCVVDGLVNTKSNQVRNANDPVEVLHY